MWEALGPFLVQDVAVAIKDEIDASPVPVSPLGLYLIFEGKYPLSAIAHQLQIFCGRFGVLDLVHEQYSKGWIQRFYFRRGEQWEPGTAMFELAR